MARREDTPFIAKGDLVTVNRGALRGVWRVSAARYASDNVYDSKISLVLTGGASMHVKATYDPDRMTVKSSAPVHQLARDIRTPALPPVLRRGGGKGAQP